MKQRGRKSSASQELTTLARRTGNVQIINYPEPPRDLSEAESFVWIGVVQNKSADWFDHSTFPLLKQYCRHSVRSDKISELVRTFEDDMDRSARGQATLGSCEISYEALLRMQHAETRVLCQLAMKMRLSQQSSIDEQSARNRVGKKSNLHLVPKS